MNARFFSTMFGFAAPAFLLGLVLGVLCAPFARAGDAGSQALRDAYAPPANTVTVTRFEAANGGRPFILDTRRGATLFRFERAREVYVLHRVPGPRGDIILKNDQGTVMVRMTRIGGPILFSVATPGGVPAWRAGTAPPLGPQSIGLANLRPAMAEVAHDMAVDLDRDTVTLAMRGADQPSAWVYLDTALNLRSAIRSLSARPKGKKSTLPDIRGAQLSRADAQNIILDNHVLKISIVPEQGFAGRPSSAKLAAFLKRQKHKKKKN